MKLRLIISLFISALLFASCNDDNETSYVLDPSTDAQIYSFTLASTHKKEGDSTSRAQDSIRFLTFNKTKFAIDQVNNIIYNPDSLPYGLNLEKAKMTLTYNSTYGVSQVNISTPDTTYTWDSSDSINFAKQPVKITVTAPGGNKKEYRVNILVHQIDPDVIKWENKGTLPSNVGRQKVLLVNNEFYSYSVLSGSVTLYTSSINNLSWTKKTVSVLPTNVDISSITYFNGQFFAISDNGRSYTSVNGESWNEQNNGKFITSIYGVLPGKTEGQDILLLSFREGAVYYFATTTDLLSVNKVNKIQGATSDNIITEFPITQMSSYSNIQRSSQSTNMLILAGGLHNSTELSSTWLVKKASEGIEISPSYNAHFKGSGLSLFPYNGMMYVLDKNQLYLSSSWGINWETTPESQILDPQITERTKQSVIVDNNNYIWIFGGVSTDGNVFFNDIWKGILNGIK